MSNWASITSADFADGGWFNAPKLTEHPAYRPAEDTVDYQNTVISKRPDSGVDVESNSSDRDSVTSSYEGGGDKIPASNVHYGYRDMGREDSPTLPPTPPSTIPPRCIKIGNEYYALTPIKPVEVQTPTPPSPTEVQDTLGVPPKHPARQYSLRRHNYPQSLPRPSIDTSHRSPTISEHDQSSPAESIRPDQDVIARQPKIPSIEYAETSSRNSISQEADRKPSVTRSLQAAFTPLSSSRRTTTGSIRNQKEAEARQSRRRSIAVPGGNRLLHMFKTEPVIKAAKLGDASEVGRLLAPGYHLHDPNAIDKEGYTALHWAAHFGHAEVASILLESHANIEKRTHKADRTPLFLAAEAGHFEIAQMLCEGGADVNATAKMDGAAPLHQAARQGYEQMVILLIQHGANVNKKDVEGMPPLMWATQGNRHGNGIAEILVRHGADLETRIKLGANLELSSREGLTILHKAVSSGNIDLARMLLEIGADVNTDGAFGMRAVHRAATKGNYKMTKLLLDFGADITLLTEESWTPLHCAARYGHKDIYDLLIEYGADPDATTKKGVQARDLAAHFGHHDIL